jgi:hypothetical protein
MTGKKLYEIGQDDTNHGNLSRTKRDMNYHNLLEKSRTGNASFDRYIEFLLKEKSALDNISVYDYEDKRTKIIDDKVKDFLNRHAGIDYKRFVEDVRPETITENLYGLIHKKSTKRVLFNALAKLYISAL